MVLKLDYKIVILFLLLFGSVFFYYSSAYFFYKLYEIFITSPISGLSVGAPVEFNGVVVGKVANIQFLPADPRKVFVYLNIQHDTPITQGTQAKIDISEIITEKLTGFPYTYISLRDDGSHPAKITRLPGQPYLLIPMSKDVTPTQPSLVKLSQAIQQSNAAIQPLFTPENVESLKQLVFSLQQLTGVLAKNSDKLDNILVNTDQASRKFGPFLNSTNDTLLTLKTETLPQVYNMTVNANQTLESVQRLLGKINNNPSIIIRGEALPKLGPGETENRK